MQVTVLDSDNRPVPTGQVCRAEGGGLVCRGGGGEGEQPTGWHRPQRHPPSPLYPPPLQVGEVCIRGPNVTSGYLNNPKANAEAYAGGWFHTGDQV